MNRRNAMEILGIVL